MAGPKPTPRALSLRARTPIVHNMTRPRIFSSRNSTSTKVVSEQSVVWTPKETMRNPQDLGVRKWNGAERTSTEWDSIRKDAELWFTNGDCLVHLYGQGQSRRGPAFKVPMKALEASHCFPLLDRFLSKTLIESPGSAVDSDDSTYFLPTRGEFYELYIPSPPNAEREAAYSYHIATRNLFAWIFGKSLVGEHLGGALVALLNSLNEFRSGGEDNVQAIMDYMDDEGYADMRNQVDYALGILHFAEHFQFRDLWIDAFAHCSGMNERLPHSIGHEHMSRTTRALVTRSRFEMDMRLDDCGRRLGTFLSDDLSDAHLGLTSSARAHLDKFRSFLQSYYVAKLGYYPPTQYSAGRAAFPKNIYLQMCSEFQRLYDYLVNSEFTSNDNLSLEHQGGICVLQCVQSFDQRHKYSSLKNPIPLLPESDEIVPTKNFHRRFSFVARDKMKPDSRLTALASLSKATNVLDQSQLACTLVRAYRGFEKECILSPSKMDTRGEKLSLTDARKVRWILIYTTLQTLLSVTRVPCEVRDAQNVLYNLSVLVAGCPPWQERPLHAHHRKQDEEFSKEFAAREKSQAGFQDLPSEIKPDVDYLALNHKPQHGRKASDATTSSTKSPRRSSVRNALSNLGNLPELRHPKPRRVSYHEILVHGYGNGTNAIITVARKDEQDLVHTRKSSDSRSSSSEEMSPGWSDKHWLSSSTTSVSSYSSRYSNSSSKKDITEPLDEKLESHRLARVPSSIYSENENETVYLQPEPVEIKKPQKVQHLNASNEFKSELDEYHGEANDELNAYLNT